MSARDRASEHGRPGQAMGPDETVTSVRVDIGDAENCNENEKSKTFLRYLNRDEEPLFYVVVVRPSASRSFWPRGDLCSVLLKSFSKGRKGISAIVMSFLLSCVSQLSEDNPEFFSE